MKSNYDGNIYTHKSSHLQTHKECLLSGKLECFFQNADISEWVILLLNVMGKCLFPIKEETPHAK